MKLHEAKALAAQLRKIVTHEHVFDGLESFRDFVRGSAFTILESAAAIEEMAERLTLPVPHVESRPVAPTRLPLLPDHFKPKVDA